VTDQFTSQGLNELRDQLVLQEGSWYVTHKQASNLKDHLEISYKNESISSQYGALHLNDSYLRLVYGPTSGWGTSVILLPVFWSQGVLYQGLPVVCTPRTAGADLVLSLKGIIGPLNVSTQVRIMPPEVDAITAEVTTRVNGVVMVDERPGEAFKLVMLSSMKRSATLWDAQAACAGEQTHQIPDRGWIIQPPAVADRLCLQGGSSSWKKNAPTVLIELDRPAQITGWVTPSENSNDDNVGFWAATDEQLVAWSYRIRVMRTDDEKS
jgi:hypothetical protein